MLGRIGVTAGGVDRVQSVRRTAYLSFNQSLEAIAETKPQIYYERSFTGLMQITINNVRAKPRALERSKFCQ